MNQNRRRQPNLGVMLLFYQLFGVIGINRIPPVTLSAIGLQVAIFLRLFKLPWYTPTDICISAYKVWRKKEYSRLLYAALEHGDDMHLYYNMISFAMKGQSLEKRYGSAKFLYILSVFTILTNAVLVALSILAGKHLGGHYEDQCAVGFSGVIFALKVLTTYHSTGYTTLMGIPIVLPTKYAVWGELLLIQMLVPNASFFGHLAGVLVGMAYVLGPLKFAMDLVYKLLKNILFPTGPRFTPRAEPSGYSSSYYASQSQPSGQRYAEYMPEGMSEEEQIRFAMEESLRRNSGYADYSPKSSSKSSPPPPPGFVFDTPDYPSAPPPPPAGLYPDFEELHAKREAHFNQ